MKELILVPRNTFEMLSKKNNNNNNNNNNNVNTSITNKKKKNHNLHHAVKQKIQKNEQYGKHTHLPLKFP